MWLNLNPMQIFLAEVDGNGSHGGAADSIQLNYIKLEREIIPFLLYYLVKIPAT